MLQFDADLGQGYRVRFYRSFIRVKLGCVHTARSPDKLRRRMSTARVHKRFGHRLLALQIRNHLAVEELK